MAFCYRYSFWFLTLVTLTVAQFNVQSVQNGAEPWFMQYLPLLLYRYIVDHSNKCKMKYIMFMLICHSNHCARLQFREKGAKKMTARMLFSHVRPALASSQSIFVLSGDKLASWLCWFFFKLTQYSVIILLLNTEVLASSVMSVTDSTTPETLPSIFHFCSAC